MYVPHAVLEGGLLVGVVGGRVGVVPPRDAHAAYALVEGRVRCRVRRGRVGGARASDAEWACARVQVGVRARVRRRVQWVETIAAATGIRDVHGAHAVVEVGVQVGLVCGLVRVPTRRDVHGAHVLLEGGRVVEPLGSRARAPVRTPEEVDVGHAVLEVGGERGRRGGRLSVSARREVHGAHALLEVALQVRVVGDGARERARRRADGAHAVLEVGVRGGGPCGRVGVSARRDGDAAHAVREVRLRSGRPRGRARVPARRDGDVRDAVHEGDVRQRVHGGRLGVPAHSRAGRRRRAGPRARHGGEPVAVRARVARPRPAGGRGNGTRGGEESREEGSCTPVTLVQGTTAQRGPRGPPSRAWTPWESPTIKGTVILPTLVSRAPRTKPAAGESPRHIPGRSTPILKY